MQDRIRAEAECDYAQMIETWMTAIQIKFRTPRLESADYVEKKITLTFATLYCNMRLRA